MRNHTKIDSYISFGWIDRERRRGNGAQMIAAIAAVAAVAVIIVFAL
jgi:hypothetical protein